MSGKHAHFAVRIAGAPTAEFVNVLAVAVICQDGTVALESAACVTRELVAAALRELADHTLANGLDHVEPRVEP